MDEGIFLKTTAIASTERRDGSSGLYQSFLTTSPTSAQLIASPFPEIDTALGRVTPTEPIGPSSWAPQDLPTPGVKVTFLRVKVEAAYVSHLERVLQAHPDTFSGIVLRLPVMKSIFFEGFGEFLFEWDGKKIEDCTEDSLVEADAMLRDLSISGLSLQWLLQVFHESLQVKRYDYNIGAKKDYTETLKEAEQRVANLKKSLAEAQKKLQVIRASIPSAISVSDLVLRGF